MEVVRTALAASSLSARRIQPLRPLCLFNRSFHSSKARSATPIPYPSVPGPPPGPPQVSASHPEDRVARKRKQAELLKRGQELRINPAKPTTALQKRFWKNVSVKTADDGLQINLDTRPVRTSSKEILTLPHNKRALATAIALEWDLLVSAHQALKQHYIPLTSLASRAMDIRLADSQSNPKIREEITNMMMRYLSTDTLLCWAPEKNVHDPTGMTKSLEGKRTASLRQRQMDVAKPIMAFLTTHVFPGVEIQPVLGEDSIMPTPQPRMTQEVIKGWIHGLPAFELAALERGVLASKSLCIAIRLLVEWSQEFRHLQSRGDSKADKFGIAQAAEASTVEVTWQTNMWGEVEDTHDVEKEDVARQLGSVIILVS